jgi:hypothetical protein
MTKRSSMLASIGSELAAPDEHAAQERATTGLADGEQQQERSQTPGTARPPQPERPSEAGETWSRLTAAASDPDRYLIDQYGIRNRYQGRPLSLRLPHDVDQALDRYVAADRTRTRTALVTALLHAYLTSTGFLARPPVQQDG